jgi:hypothetical protein
MAERILMNQLKPHQLRIAVRELHLDAQQRRKVANNPKEPASVRAICAADAEALIAVADALSQQSDRALKKEMNRDRTRMQL